MAQVKLKGNSVKTNGELPQVGSKAPDIRAITTDLQEKTLKDFAGKKKVICFVPSLDTSVCSTSAKKFSEKVKGRSDVALIYISADLPFALARSCLFEGVVPLSLVRSKKTAEAYGVLILDGPLEGLCARAVLVLDSADKVVYQELVGEITTEPNYDLAWKNLG
jgi:thiol peroxidase